jgi:hypothetical protein
MSAGQATQTQGSKPGNRVGSAFLRVWHAGVVLYVTRKEEAMATKNTNLGIMQSPAYLMLASNPIHQPALSVEHVELAT